MSDQKLIFKKLAAVMADVKPVAKSGYNPSQRFNFRTVDDTVAHVQTAMVKHGVVMVPEILSVEHQTETTAKGGFVTICHVQVGYTFFAEDGSSICMTMQGEGRDHGDKATSKALSMALKYALFQVFLIPTGEADPDSEIVEIQADPNALTQADKTKIAVLGKKAGLDRNSLREAIQDAVGRPITSTSDLVKADLTEIEAYLAEMQAATANAGEKGNNE